LSHCGAGPLRRRARESNPQLLPATDFESASGSQKLNKNSGLQIAANNLLTRKEKYLATAGTDRRFGSSHCEIADCDSSDCSHQIDANKPLRATSLLAYELDMDAILEREEFERAFNASVHCLSCGSLLADGKTSLCDKCEFGGRQECFEEDEAAEAGARATDLHAFLTVTQIAKLYVDADGQRRCKSWHRMQLAQLQRQSGFAKATYLRADVDALYSERRFALKSIESRDQPEPRSETEEKLLALYRRVVNPADREKLLKIIALFVDG
jgi:hypothetical protein